jgi:signal transduction histidine kinase
MNNLMELISNNEDWVLRRVVEYAKIHEYTRYTSTLIEAWRISIASLNVAMFNAIKTNDVIEPPNLDDKFNESAIDKFSIEEVHKHRARGITLGMFLGLVKYYRRSYFDLIREQNFDIREEREYLAFLENFFDRFEVGYSVEWNSLNDNQAVDELRNQNRVLTNEKNKYLTIFESLYDPVILLDRNNHIENINQAAAELFQEYDLPAHRYYDQKPVNTAFPWLAQEITVFSQSREQEMIIVKSMQTLQGERHYQVKMKRMQDFSEKYPGTVVILNDLTERMKKEEVITLNRAIQRWVNTLVDLSRRISSGMDIEEILLMSMESVYNLTEPEVAVLGMWEPEHEQFRIKYQVTGQGLEKTDFVFSSEDLKVVSEGVVFPIQQKNIGHVFPILLKTNEQVIGGLWIGRAQDVPFTASDKMVLESIAQQISIAIEHALMTAQIQSGAIVEERARLAREMHDGLSQILGFLSLEMQSLELLVHQGKIDETLAELHRARTRIRDAQAEVRENILNLRTALSKDGEAIPFLCEYIREFGTQTGIETHIEQEGGQKTSLLPICEVQLVRIIQEALTNIRLHADANNVWVKFYPKQGNLCVEIIDDGIGFIETTLKKHFGLKSMRERTESVNGKLTIDSRPGHGTHITLCLPLIERVVHSRQEILNAQATAA